MSRLKCMKCEHEMAMPAHCNRPMQKAPVKGEEKLVCWMGPDCGVADVPKHCGQPMREVLTA